MLEHLIELILPYIISVCEIIGILVVTVSALQAFYQYLKQIITRRSTNFKFQLAQGLASGLEFKMAAEILKTVLVRSLDELIILGAVILLRAAMTFLIQWEIRLEKKSEQESGKEKG